VVRIVYFFTGQQLGGASDAAQNILEIFASDSLMSNIQGAQINAVAVDRELGSGLQDGLHVAASRFAVSDGFYITYRSIGRILVATELGTAATAGATTTIGR